jgi:Cdc6-like AAA superfamily ATPase
LVESDEYRAWRDGNAGVLWYYGAPGVGKTLLASIVISDLNSHSTTTSASALVTHYFCDFVTREQQTPVAVFQSILRQVIHNGNADILSVVGEDSDTSESLQNTNTLVQILARVSSLETNGYLVLDAPDELERPASVLPHLRPLVDSGWRILVTSRDIPSIRKSLSKAVEYEIKASSKDVETYVFARFQELDLDNQIHDCTALVDQIVMKADGL